jgi:hypothetical protein
MAVGSTRLRRVQFGVPPNCVGKRTMEITWTNEGKLCPQTVSGVTPETTRGRGCYRHNPATHSQDFNFSRKICRAR